MSSTRENPDPKIDELDDEEDENDEDEEDDEDGEDESETISLPAARERAPRTRARAVKQAPVSVPLSTFGGCPVEATHWSMIRLTQAGVWDQLSYAKPGTSVSLREWPLAELTEAEVERRWGLGTYKVQWVAPRARGGRQVIRGGARTFDIVRPEAPPAPAYVSRETDDPNEATFRLMDRFDQRKTNDLENLVRVAGMLTGAGQSRQDGISFADLRQILRDEREAAAKETQAALQASEARLAAKIAELTEDDGAEAPGGAVAAAAGLAGPFIKGKGWLPTAVNLAAAQPELAEVVIGKVAAVAIEALSLFKRKDPPAQQQPEIVAAVVERPRAIHGGQPSASDDRPVERVIIPSQPGDPVSLSSAAAQ